MGNVELEAGLKTYGSVVNERLNEILLRADREPAVLQEAMRYAVLAPAKRLRPILCMECARLVGSKPEMVVDAACAIELVHCFSLIHDDLPAIDNDEVRRGQPTVHIKFSEAVAILAGDALFALAFEVLASSAEDDDRVRDAMLELARASGTQGLVGGEMLDILSEGQWVSGETVKMIHRRKTAALFSAACAIGALLAGANMTQLDHLRNFGMQLGLAFQITDDILNETGDPTLTGKATGSDKERGKATYPGTFGLSAAEEAADDACREAIWSLDSFGEDAEMLRSMAKFSVERKN